MTTSNSSSAPSRATSLVETFNGLTTPQKLLIITSLGFLLRLYVTFAAVTIATDSINYINIAKEFTGGNYYGIFNMDRPPLYPLLLSLVSYVIPDYEMAGRVVSLVFGTLVIPITFYLGRLIYNERIGLVTAFFVAIHPYLIRYSGEVLTEGLYYFMAASVTFFGLKAIRDKSVYLMFLVGLMGVLAYLTKPGGIGFLMIISVLIVATDYFGLKGGVVKNWVKKVLMLGASWAVYLVFSLPYLLYLRQESGGEVILTGRGTVADVGHTAVKVVTTGHSLDAFASHFPEAFTYPFFLLFLVFLWKIVGRIRRRDFTWVELCFFGIQVFYYVIYITADAHRRYLVQVMPLGMVMSALGFIYIADHIKKKKKETAILSIALLLLFFTAVQLPKGLTRLKAHHLPEKLAGQWFVKNNGAGRLILTKSSLMPYYAEGVYLQLPRDVSALKDAVAYGKERNALFMAGYTRKLREIYSDFDQERDEVLLEVETFTGKKEGDFVIYTIR